LYKFNVCEITRNLATQIGIYNGATGTVVGFGFHTAIPEENFPTVNTFHTLQTENCRLCLLNWIHTLVHNYLLSTDVDKQNIVPFTECVHEIKLTVNGTHYMRWQLPLILAYTGKLIIGKLSEFIGILTANCCPAVLRPFQRCFGS
jgi:hypothetical protein